MSTDLSEHNMSLPINVMVVDDHYEGRRLLSLMLKDEGFEVRTAASGCEALEAILESPPDMVLLDVMMPDMAGRCCGGFESVSPPPICPLSW